MNEPMTKQQQFLWTVQTIVLANAINLSRDDERADRYRHEFSATGVYMTSEEALRASEMIPVNKSAAQAAREFCFYMLSNLRDSNDKVGEQASVPAWFART